MKKRRDVETGGAAARSSGFHRVRMEETRGTPHRQSCCLPPVPLLTFRSRFRAASYFLLLAVMAHGAPSADRLFKQKREDRAGALQAFRLLTGDCDALAGTFGDSRFNGSLASETPQAKAAFRTAEVLAKGGRHLRAANAYGRLEHSVKNTELAAYANLLRAECLANAGRAGKALPLLDTFKTRYRKTKRAGEGLLLAGCLSAGALRNTRQAGRYFRLSADIRTDRESAQRALFYLATLSQWGKRRREEYDKERKGERIK